MSSVVTAAATEAITTAFRCRIAKDPRITSIANIMPAIGALKLAPIPAPAPAATRLRMRSWSKPVYLARDDPIEAPM